MRIRVIYISLILLCAVAAEVQAQTPSILLLGKDTAWSSRGMMIMVGGDAGISTNALNVDFLEKSILGGHFERNELKELYDGLPSESKLGYAVHSEITFLSFADTLLGNPNLGVRASLSTNYEGYCGFRPNAFGLVYLGNGDLKPGIVDIGEFIYGNQAWQKMGFGLFNKSTLSGFTLSLVAGQSFQSLAIDEAQFFTSAVGDSLSLDLDGVFTRSNAKRKGLANGNGLGACIDFDFNLPLADKSGMMSFSARNMGFIVWNSKTETRTLNTALQWNGLDVTNWLSGATDTLELPTWTDSVRTPGELKETFRFLPASFSFRYMKRITSAGYIETGCSFFPNRVAFPLAYVGMMHLIGNGFSIGERISYGGYGNFAMGMEVQWLSRSAWFVRAGAAQLEGWLFAKAGGRNLFLNVGKSF
jgi:hypothetical protein